MNSKNIIKSLIVFLTLSGLIIPVACSEDNTTTNSMSEELYQHLLREAVTSNSTVAEVRQMVNESKLTDPFLLNLSAKQDYVLAVSGTIPITNTGMESYEWWSNLDELAATLAQEDVFNGIVNSKITGIEANAGGHLTIKILAGQENKNIDGDLKIIIETVNKYAEAQNIKDVPLVIREEEIPIGFTAETEYTAADNSNAVAAATNPAGWFNYLLYICLPLF